MEGPLLPDSPIALVASASMTPAFIVALGHEHGSGPRVSLVIALVLLNVVLALVALAQLARERELAALRNDFVAGVSHELRTPLAQIRMFSETLLLDRIRNVSERRRALEIIGQESRRLTQLVDNVLLFHRRSRTTAHDLDVAELRADGLTELAQAHRVDIHGPDGTGGTDSFRQTAREIAVTGPDVGDVGTGADAELTEDVGNSLPLVARNLNVVARLPCADRRAGQGGDQSGGG